MGRGREATNKRPMLVEVVACSVADAQAAKRLGVDRVEVCASIEHGGITPSIDLTREIRSQVGIPMAVMIRCRAGDFCYSESELAVMAADAEELNEATALVFGALTRAGDIDSDACRRIMGLWRTPTIFHRAFDSAPDPFQALETVIELGYKRVLTSGGKATALEGADTIRKLVEQAKCRIEIMAGGGIRGSNVREILERTGVRQIHLGPFKMDGTRLVLDEEAVEAVLSAVR